jgi:hypothetical protein
VIAGLLSCCSSGRLAKVAYRSLGPQYDGKMAQHTEYWLRIFVVARNRTSQIDGEERPLCYRNLTILVV